MGDLNYLKLQNLLSLGVLKEENVMFTKRSALVMNNYHKNTSM